MKIVKKPENDIIILNGTAWDRSNLTVFGQAHFTHEEALKLASERGKRLPTPNEARAVSQNPRCVVYENICDENPKGDATKIDISLYLNKKISFNFNGYISPTTNQILKKSIFCVYWHKSPGVNIYNGIEQNTFFYNSLSGFGRERFSILAKCSVRLVKNI